MLRGVLRWATPKARGGTDPCSCPAVQSLQVRRPSSSGLSRQDSHGIAIQVCDHEEDNRRSWRTSGTTAPESDLTESEAESRRSTAAADGARRGSMNQPTLEAEGRSRRPSSLIVLDNGTTARLRPGAKQFLAEASGGRRRSSVVLSSSRARGEDGEPVSDVEAKRDGDLSDGRSEGSRRSSFRESRSLSFSRDRGSDGEPLPASPKSASECPVQLTSGMSTAAVWGGRGPAAAALFHSLEDGSSSSLAVHAGVGRETLSTEGSCLTVAGVSESETDEMVQAPEGGPTAADPGGEEDARGGQGVSQPSRRSLSAAVRAPAPHPLARGISVETITVNKIRVASIRTAKEKAAAPSPATSPGNKSLFAIGRTTGVSLFELPPPVSTDPVEDANHHTSTGPTQPSAPMDLPPSIRTDDEQERAGETAAGSLPTLEDSATRPTSLKTACSAPVRPAADSREVSKPQGPPEASSCSEAGPIDDEAAAGPQGNDATLKEQRVATDGMQKGTEESIMATSPDRTGRQAIQSDDVGASNSGEPLLDPIGPRIAAAVMVSQSPAAVNEAGGADSAGEASSEVPGSSGEETGTDTGSTGPAHPPLTRQKTLAIPQPRGSHDSTGSLPRRVSRLSFVSLASGGVTEDDVLAFMAQASSLDSSFDAGVDESRETTIVKRTRKVTRNAEENTVVSHADAHNLRAVFDDPLSLSLVCLPVGQWCVCTAGVDSSIGRSPIAASRWTRR